MKGAYILFDGMHPAIFVTLAFPGLCIINFGAVTVFVKIVLFLFDRIPGIPLFLPAACLIIIDMIFEGAPAFFHFGSYVAGCANLYIFCRR